MFCKLCIAECLARLAEQMSYRWKKPMADTVCVTVRTSKWGVTTLPPVE
jgi:hypothetical protein